MADASTAKKKSREYGSKLKTLGEGILEYKGIEVGIFEEEPIDKTPARIAQDARTGKEFIYMVDTVPKKLYIPILEHELYEIKHGYEKHDEADKHAEKIAKKMGVSEDFKKFKAKWMERRKKLEEEGL